MLFFFFSKSELLNYKQKCVYPKVNKLWFIFYFLYWLRLWAARQCNCSWCVLIFDFLQKKSNNKKFYWAKQEVFGRIVFSHSLLALLRQSLLIWHPGVVSGSTNKKLQLICQDVWGLAVVFQPKDFSGAVYFFSPSLFTEPRGYLENAILSVHHMSWITKKKISELQLPCWCMAASRQKKGPYWKWLATACKIPRWLPFYMYLK